MGIFVVEKSVVLTCNLTYLDCSIPKCSGGQNKSRMFEILDYPSNFAFGAPLS